MDKKLVKKLDDIFSKYIRLRFADSNGFVKCFTSGKILHWKDAHCGHFISRRHYSTRWDEKNCQVQSVAENIYNQGNAPQFAVNLDLKYGKGTAEMLLIKSKNVCKINNFELTFLIKEYTEKVKNILNEKR